MNKIDKVTNVAERSLNLSAAINPKRRTAFSLCEEQGARGARHGGTAAKVSVIGGGRRKKVDTNASLASALPVPKLCHPRQSRGTCQTKVEPFAEFLLFGPLLSASSDRPA